MAGAGRGLLTGAPNWVVVIFLFLLLLKKGGVFFLPPPFPCSLLGSDGGFGGLVFGVLNKKTLFSLKVTLGQFFCLVFFSCFPNNF